MRPIQSYLFRNRYCTGLFLAGLLLANNLPAQAQSRRAPLADVQLAKNVHGDEAVQSLGSRLKAVAEFHHMQEGELRGLFQSDRSLWVDRRGRLFYVCEFGLPQGGPVGESTNTPPLSPPYQLNQTFKLHSRPGASRVIFLDFDGHDASTTIWGNSAGSAPISRSYDTDGSPYVFGTAERTSIQYIWSRVAEDYLQYDIDVTTEDPGAATLKNTGTGRYGVRVAIGGDWSDWFGSSAGGVAYLFSFDDGEDLPCWVFPKSLGPDNEKSIAEACSHEAGHTLGLSHDGQTTGVDYYTGHGNWAPIMGVGYDRPIVQWSRGEYNLANNSEDDLTKMLSYGAIPRPDDYGDNIAEAKPLTGVKPFLWGVISTRTDVDFFSFEAGAGRTTITVTPAPRGPNLHILVSLYDGNGSLITSSNVADNSTSGVLPVTLTTILPTGNYFVSVDGIGTGNPLNTGYSDYSSLGQYTMTVTLPGDSTWAATSGGGYSWMTPANWNSSTIPLGLSGIARINNNITGDQDLEIDRPITLGGLLLGDADASHAFTLHASGSGVLRLGGTNGNAWITKLTGLNDFVTAPLELQSNLVVTNNSAADLVLAGTVDGAFTLTKSGTGRLVLAGTDNASAGLVVASGTLQLGDTASIDSVAAITVQSNALFDVTAQPAWQLASARMLAGEGVITGAVSTASGSRLVPGTGATPGILTFANRLTLNDGTALDFNLGATTNTDTGVNDLITVAGNLVLNGTVAVNFDFAGALPETNGTYTILTYGGTLTGGAVNFVAASAGNRFTYTFDDSVPGEIRVAVSGVPATLIWQGGALGNLWDVGGATNWLNGGGPDAFFQGDAVLFDPSGSAVPDVDLSGTLSPTSLTVSNTTSYTFSGSGRLSGTSSIVKQGLGSLTLNTSNDFSGATLIQDGTLLIGNTAALGLTNSGTTITNTGQLNLNGFALGTERLTLSGSGPVGDGALINTGGDQTNALRNVTLAGDTTIGGSGRWDIRGIPAANITASLTGNGFALTKTGANEVWLANLGSTLLGNITVNQGTLGFEGANTMANASSPLTVNPGATLAFLNAFDSDFSKMLVLNSCTLQNDSGHNNLVGAVTLSGTVTVSAGEAATLDMRATVLGSGGFTKTGAGILRLAGGNTFSGNVLISAGTVMAGNNAALGSTAGTTTISPGGRLDLAAFNLGAEPVFVAGAGINNRGVIINSLITSQPNALRFVTLTGDTTIGGNGRWDIRANPTGALLGAFNLTKVGGNEIWLANLDVTQLKTITVSEGTLGFQGTTTMGDASSTITVNFGGALGISTTGTNILSKILALNTGRMTNSVGSNTVTGNVSLIGANQIDVNTGSTLVLGGAVTGSGSFIKASPGTLALAGANTSSGVTVVSAGTLQIGAGDTSGSFAGVISNRAALVFDRITDLTHAAVISGFGTLSKQNTNTLTLSGANIFSGVTTVNAGTLRVGSTAALGSTAAGTTVASGATLDVNGFNLGAEVITASGPGFAGAGAIINAGASQNNALQFLTLAGDATVGGSTRWDLRGVSGVGALSTGGQPYSLTKTGSNTIALNNVTVDGALGNIAVQQGVLSVEQGTTGLGNPSTSATVSSGAILQLYSLTNALNKIIILEDAGKLSHNGPVSGGISSTVNGPITLIGNNATMENSSTAYSLQINNAVGGSGNCHKIGPGLVQLNGTNTYTGATIISSGTLKLGPAATVNLTREISLDGGTVLDVASLGGGFVLNAGQTLSGDGTVVGNVIAHGTIAPGDFVGRLTVSGNALLAGDTVMQLYKFGTTFTNDVLNVTGTLTCGGTLVVARCCDPLALNDSFRLFSAGAMMGSFTSYSLPVLNSGLTWNVSTLNSDGWLRVVSNTPPVIASVGLNGNGIVISGSGGAPGAVYYVMTATDVALPLPQWSPVATNVFDAGGNFSFTNTIAPTNGQQFFRLRVP